MHATMKDGSFGITVDIDGQTQHLKCVFDHRQYGDHQFSRAYMEIELPSGQKLGLWGIEAARWAWLMRDVPDPPQFDF
jgi:hypothetical protein